MPRWPAKKAREGVEVTHVDQICIGDLVTRPDDVSDWEVTEIDRETERVRLRRMDDGRKFRGPVSKLHLVAACPWKGRLFPAGWNDHMHVVIARAK